MFIQSSIYSYHTIRPIHSFNRLFINTFLFYLELQYVTYEGKCPNRYDESQILVVLSCVLGTSEDKGTVSTKLIRKRKTHGSLRTVFEENLRWHRSLKARRRVEEDCSLQKD